MAITVLTQDVVNQIAAGEVVERPSHMVKELVENSLDAGATEVEVDIELGGRRIRVKDNGVGISKADLPLALARHATSKINKTSDLWSLDSFGFRGEALASISAVSRLQIKSKTAQDEHAHQIVSEFGKTDWMESIGGEVGTTILVDELFENVPARLKFLKSEAAESSQIKNSLKALAMAHPKVAFRVRQAGKLVYFWQAVDSRLERAKQVLEREQLFFSEASDQGISAQVVYSSPNDTVGNSRSIWLFAQNRWIQDRSLQTAVFEAYRNLLMHGEYPVVAAWVECAADEIDVNIHPAKSQVKFLNPSQAFRVLQRALRKGLESAPWLEGLLQNPVEKSVQNFSLQYQERIQENASFAAPEFSKVHYPQRQFQKVEENRQAYTAENPFVRSSSIAEPQSAESQVSELQTQVTDQVKRANETSTSRGWQDLQVLGQADLTYIIAQSQRALIFVDQHAAHERVMFETLMENFKAGRWEVQNYLVPLTVNLAAEAVEQISARQEELQKMGFSVEAMGPDVLAVTAAPALLKDQAVYQVLEKMANDIVELGDSFVFEKKAGDLMATMACHSAVRAGQALSLEQMQHLLKQMDDYPLSSFCPHGRPVYVEYPFSRLERDFGRIV